MLGRGDLGSDPVRNVLRADLHKSAYICCMSCEMFKNVNVKRRADIWINAKKHDDKKESSIQSSFLCTHRKPPLRQRTDIELSSLLHLFELERTNTENYVKIFLPFLASIHVKLGEYQMKLSERKQLREYRMCIRVLDPCTWP